MFLAYGPDTGLVRETAQRLARRYSGNDAGGMDLVTLDGGEARQRSGRLAVEAKTQSLFGDRRVVRVRGAGKIAWRWPLAELLEDPAGAMIDPRRRQPGPQGPALRALVEASKRGQRPALLPRQRQIAASDSSPRALLEAGINADPDVAPTLRDILGNDREVTRRELEKLAALRRQRARR